MRRVQGGQSNGHSPIWRRLRRTAAGFCIVVVIAAAAGYPVYVRPQIDPIRKADAVFILGGPGYGRYPLGLELGTQGWAPTVVVSNPNGPRDPWLTEQCAHPQTFQLICFVPEPPTTKGEGRELRQLAAEHGWRRVIVVTFRPHISRARSVLRRCFDGELIMVEPADRLSTERWVLEYIYQTLGYMRATLDRGC